MALFYEIIQYQGHWVPIKRSDDTDYTRRLCLHKHKSRAEAEKCLTRNLPRDMKYMRKV